MSVRILRDDDRRSDGVPYIPPRVNGCFDAEVLFVGGDARIDSSNYAVRPPWLPLEGKLSRSVTTRLMRCSRSMRRVYMFIAHCAMCSSSCTVCLSTEMVRHKHTLTCVSEGIGTANRSPTPHPSCTCGAIHLPLKGKASRARRGDGRAMLAPTGYPIGRAEGFLLSKGKLSRSNATRLMRL